MMIHLTLIVPQTPIKASLKTMQGTTTQGLSLVLMIIARIIHQENVHRIQVHQESAMKKIIVIPTNNRRGGKHFTFYNHQSDKTKEIG